MDELKSWQKKPDSDEQKKSGSSRRRRKKRNPFVEFLQLYGKYIILALVAILVVVTVIIVVGKVKKNGKDKETTVIDLSSSASPEQGGTLEKDAHPEINALVNSYFTAVQNCDVSALAKLVDSTESISEEQLKAEKEFVESYQNMVCYTLNGLVDGTYIVYVSYDMKFLNVETPAPCLIRLYVCTNDAGDIYIYNQDVDNEIAAYMEEVNTREDVKALLKETDDKLTEAMAGDEALNALVTKLYGNEQDNNGESSSETTGSSESSSADNSVFTDVDETVYAKENVKVRKTPDANGEVAGSLAGGQSVHRTGYNDGWSRVEFNGETCYVAAGYLTATAPESQAQGDGFTEVDETVYAKETVRIRKTPDVNGEVAGSLLTGESIKRTGYNDSWSRVIYEGETCYIGAGYLTTAAPAESE
ncbi:SH3 domain-containing protein [Qiania dongpingensis]|uniref:SH3 domain-containing protein n=1 Tax=Qiania dongpingensis TaxID=2763669 RepID=A0A7G9G3B3_9FIRM|nr:SH3 domain-containing protein [Qiania dongpingensis]QNM05295.1 SH3 domain-containing protein [Qiania dongpingensis]